MLGRMWSQSGEAGARGGRPAGTYHEALRLRVAEAEAHQLRLARLAVAGQRLTTALDVRGVLDVVHEILVNLIGADAFRVYLVRAVAARPVLDRVPVLAAGRFHGRVDRARVREALAERAVRLSDTPGDGPVAIVPLVVGRDVLGALVVDRLVEPRERVTASDGDLLRLLSHAAGLALYAAVVRTEIGLPSELPSWIRRQLDLDAVGPSREG